MPRIEFQKDFQRWRKPPFCYLCGQLLDDGTELNEDHCPPVALFRPEDRANFPIKLQVHRRCNHVWHAVDERLATLYAMMHGSITELDGRRREPTFQSVRNEQGIYLGMSDLPLKEFVLRIVRCAHALLYGEWLPDATPNHVHVPLPEVDVASSNRPKMHLPQTYSFADTLCSAQKCKTFDCIVAYGRRFKYVTTWTHADKGEPICLFAMDIYELHRLGIFVKDFPKAVIGMYRCPTPPSASRATGLKVTNSDEEILYPVLI